VVGKQERGRREERRIRERKRDEGHGMEAKI